MAKKVENNPPKQEDFAEKLAHADEVIGESLSRTQELSLKYKNQILGAFGAILLAVAAYFAYDYYLKSAEEAAQKELVSAVFNFEKDSLNAALLGDNFTIGFEKIAQDYSSTKAGNLARFYLGIIYLKENKFEQAIEALNKFSSSDYILQARAYCLLGDVYSEKGDDEKAINFYKKAAYHKLNEEFSPQYLIKLGLTYERKGDKASAAKAYQEILDNFPRCVEVNDAKKFLAMVE
jgi:tetratricopeptide (TPR) repeat protein